MVSDPSAALRGALLTAGLLGIAYGLRFLWRLRWTQDHRQFVLAMLALVVGIAAVLAAVWSPSVRRALGAFATSAGLGGLAVAVAAGLALYGVLRQLGAQSKRGAEDAEQARASEYAEHYRWVTERVLLAEYRTDADVIEVIVRDLFARAVTPTEEAVAVKLGERHVARLKNSRPLADESTDEDGYELGLDETRE